MSHRLAKLATRLDTLGARRRLRRFRTGWPARTSDDVRFYQSPKVQYRYRERGAGPTIVFTVDPPATLELYDDLLALFATRFRVLAVELPAMGFSAPRGSYRFGWRETNDDLGLFTEAGRRRGPSPARRRDSRRSGRRSARPPPAGRCRGTHPRTIRRRGAP